MAVTYTLSRENAAGDLPSLIAARTDLSIEAPVVVVLHGLGSRKEKMLTALYEFASLGCRAVAMDLRFHGERPDAWERDARLQANYFGTTSEMIEGTAQDVSRLLDHFSPTRAGIHGISLGGYIAFAALVSDPRLTVSSVALGSPDWVTPLRQFGLGPGNPIFDHAASLNPLGLLPKVLPPRALLMLHGSLDQVVPVEGVIALEKNLRPLYRSHPERLELQVNPELGHEYTDDMLRHTRTWFERFLLDGI